MAIRPKYTGKPLQFNADEETKRRVRRLADLREVSQAQVMRELIEAGLDDAERKAGVFRDWWDHISEQLSG